MYISIYISNVHIVAKYYFFFFKIRKNIDQKGQLLLGNMVKNRHFIFQRGIKEIKIETK